MIERKLDVLRFDSALCAFHIHGLTVRCKVEVLAIIHTVFVIFRRDAGSLEVLVQIALDHVFRELPRLAVGHTGEGAGEVYRPRLLEPVVVVERTAIVAEHRIIFRRQNDIGRSGGADAAQLLDLTPVLDDAHETGNSLV